MSRDDELRLKDLLDAIERVRTYLPSEREPLEGATRDAILYNLIVIGEAAAHLSDETSAAAPEIPWPQIVGLRNLLAHEYFRIDTAIVTEIVRTRLTPLDTCVRELLRDGR